MVEVKVENLDFIMGYHGYNGSAGARYLICMVHVNQTPVILNLSRRICLTQYSVDPQMWLNQPSFLQSIPSWKVNLAQKMVDSSYPVCPKPA